MQLILHWLSDSEFELPKVRVPGVHCLTHGSMAASMASGSSLLIAGSRQSSMHCSTWFGSPGTLGTENTTDIANPERITKKIFIFFSLWLFLDKCHRTNVTGYGLID